MKINKIQCKSILTKSALPESDYVINPYVGCGHACRYCYASFMRRFTGHGTDRWGTFVDIKVNAAEVLDRQLRRSLTGTVLLGSVTDCYMPLERKYGLTRQCLEVLAKHQNSSLSVSVLTKNALVARDIDLLRQLRAEVGLTITSDQESVARVFEPGASSPAQRAQALRDLHEAGISTYVFIGPILPGLTNCEKILNMISDSADSVMAEVLNFRGCATNCDEIVAERFPEALAEWKSARADPSVYATHHRTILERLCHDRGIPLTGFYAH